VNRPGKWLYFHFPKHFWSYWTGLPASNPGPVWILKPIPSVLGRAKNLIQTVLLIRGKVLLFHSIYRLPVTGGWGTVLETMLVHTLFSGC